MPRARPDLRAAHAPAQLWKAICGTELKQANKALDHVTEGRGDAMAARGKLPDAVQRKVAVAVKENWPSLFGERELDKVFEKRTQIGGRDVRAPHLKDFQTKVQFGNAAAVLPLPQPGVFDAGA